LKRLKKLITKENEEDNTEVDETENLTETEKENLLHLEIEDKLNKEIKKKNKKIKKREKMKLKAQMRTGLGGNVVDDFFEAPEEMGLFTLSSIKGKEQLDDINNDEEPDIKIDSEEDNDEQEDSSSGSDPDELKRDYANEQYLDLLYEQYLIESSKYRHGISKRNQENKNKQKKWKKYLKILKIFQSTLDNKIFQMKK